MPLRVGLFAVLLAASCFAAGADPVSASSVASAGPDSCLQAGQRVRVRYEERDRQSILHFLRIPHARHGEVVGELVRGDARKLSVRTDAGDGVVAIVAAERVVSIERSVGNRRATVTGLRTGALLGLCITPLVWYGEGQGDDGVDSLPTAAWTIGGAAVIGALLGTLGHEDVWERVKREAVVSVASRPDEAAVRVAIRGRF